MQLKSFVLSPSTLLARLRAWLGTQRTVSPRGAIAVSVVALHVLLAYVFILALAQHEREPPRELTLSLSPAGPRVTPNPVQKPILVAPKIPEVPAPEFRIPELPTNPITVAPAPAALGVTVPAEAIGETRSLPALSEALLAIARKTVLRLKLLVAPDGSISEATVDSSTGSPEIDNLALAWVKAHWRYKPAMRDGVAVPESTMALVPF
ncbi:MAG: energy transducer TonB [Reyranella sp.]|nr:energy transducer TonB [Reyranella sp.]MBL6851915.1 energy transducer TonB [Alphaproteobacteria bacterium]